MNRVKLGDVAYECKAKASEEEIGVLPIVGLEHLNPEDLELGGCDEGSDTTFTKKFSKGQVLFGRRRAYLKKAAVAPMDGICSGDITVIAADDQKLSPRLLPFIIQNERLFDYAVGNSAGSLSPRVKWANLSQYEFDLPSLEKQEELAELLWAGEKTKRLYQKLLKASDDIVKSRFVEMFGSADCGYKYEVRKLGELLSTEPQNGLYKPQKDYVSDGGGSPIVRVDAFADGVVTDYASLKRLLCTDAELNSYGLCDGDLVINRVNGSIERVGKVALIQNLLEPTVFESNMMRFHVNEARLNNTFIVIYLCSDDIRKQIKACARIANQCSINQGNVMGFDVPVPPLELQQDFADFVAQVDKSRFTLQQALDDLSATMKAILDEELGLGDV